MKASGSRIYNPEMVQRHGKKDQNTQANTKKEKSIKIIIKLQKW